MSNSKSIIYIPEIGNDWDQVLASIWPNDKIQNVLEYVGNPKPDQKEIFPPKTEILNALKCTSYSSTKVVILGQDPYINKGQAHGFAFSVNVGMKIPPSLMNIYKELKSEMGCFIPNNGYLVPWAMQGVLLLNTILTVESGRSKSHSKLGWEVLTDHIIQLLSNKNERIVFMLWGNDAKKKIKLIDTNWHLVLQAAHPSPLAGGAFFGCNHFIKCNEFLEKTHSTPINWQIPNIYKK